MTRARSLAWSFGRFMMSIVTLAFSCGAVWRGPGQAQRLFQGLLGRVYAWRPVLRLDER